MSGEGGTCEDVRRGRWSALGGSLAAALALALGVGVPEAGAVTCGQTVTKDVKLHKDLLNCPAGGLVVGAGQIKIDLNGHRLDGVVAINSVGIKNVTPAYADVVVKGRGQITEFASGVVTAGSGGSVREVTVKDARTYGIQLAATSAGVGVRDNKIVRTETYGIGVGGDDHEVTHNTVIGPKASMFSSAGIIANGSSTEDNLIKSNQVQARAPSSNAMLVFATAQRTRIVNNTFSGAIGNGLQIYDSAHDTLAKKNVSKRNALDGILVLLTAGTGTRLIANRANRNGSDGIQLNASSIEVGKNVANHNGAWGIVGLNVPIDLGGNKAAHNGQPGQCAGIACS